MAIYTTARRARINAAITRKTAQLEKANITYESLLSKEIEEYRFDSNEGAQRARRRNLNEMKNQIDSLESEIERLYRKLQSTGIVNFALRRN